MKIISHFTLCWVAVCCTVFASSKAPSSAVPVVLEDGELLVGLDPNSGALTRLDNKTAHWAIERRPELGVSFRLHAPLPSRRDNFVLGRDQHATEVRKVSDHEVRLQWKNLKSEHGGMLPVTITATVTLENGRLSFKGELANDSAVTVETVDYPYFGDLNPPEPDATLSARTMWYGNLSASEIHPTFKNEKGYWGVDFPTQTIDSKRSLFCLIQAPEKGIYVEVHDSTQRYLIQYTFEQHPGLLSSVTNRVPRMGEIPGLPVHLEFRMCHFLFAHPHTTVNMVPIVVRCYTGDWHAGVDLYKTWRATWFKQLRLPAWAREVHSWVMLRMSTPEEDYRVSYKDFVTYGAEYAAAGVRAVQLVGWNIGGQDRNDPLQDTDPKLGTWRELHDAIAKVQSMSVKVILFGKLNWADMTMPAYAQELYKYQATDPYGIPYQQGGYSYVTPTQLAGINNRRRAVMDFLCPAYRDIAVNEFNKVLALGAAGWLWDEICHHGAAIYNFAPGHGYEPPGFIYAGDLPMSAGLRAAADKVDPEFLFSGEGPEDRLMQYFPFSETGVTPTPICQYIDSRCRMVAGISGFDDREQLNRVLMYCHIIQYEPFYYKGHINEFPLTLAYGLKIDVLRSKYRAWLWDGDFRDTVGASVQSNGNPLYSVFVASSGKRAVVVVNPTADKPITATVTLPNPGNLVTATPENPEPKPGEGAITIPARSVAVVLEQ